MKMTLLIILCFCCSLGFAQKGRFTVKVIDYETSEPIEGAGIHAGFNMDSGGLGAGRPNREKGETNAEGLCQITGRGDYGSAGFGVGGPKKTTSIQYYSIGGFGVRFTGTSGLVFKRWEPWDQKFTVKLQRVKNPIPLYAKRLQQEAFPKEESSSYGYDFMIGDWIKPYGKGEVADITFETTRKNLGSFKAPYTKDLYYPLYHDTFTISLPGKDCGLIPVIPEKHLSLKLREAPERGYQKTFIRYCSQEEKEGDDYFLKRTNNDNPDRCFYFRIRVEHDEQGNIKSALYGKIYGDFEMHYSGWVNHSISFTYYFNPTPNDRNLEFDGENNLFRPDWRDGQQLNLSK